MLRDPLILTVLLEGFALLLMREKSPLFYLYWTAVSTLTNLPLNLYLSLVFSGSALEYWLTVAFLEILVLGIEFLLCLLYTSDVKKSLKYSAICNFTSFFIGLIIVYF